MTSMIQNSQDGNAASARRYSPFALAILNVIDFPGRRGVRLFRISREHFGLAALLTIMLGMPFAFFLAFLPLWDFVGEFSPLKALNSFLAPEISALSYGREDNGIHIKRSLIAAISMVELIFALNALSMVSRANRRHALMVWYCYDRRKFFIAFAISSLIFLICWFVLFYSWDFFRVMTDGDPRGGRIGVYIVGVFPFAAFLAGHLAAILGVAGARAISLKLRLVRGTSSLKKTCGL